LSFVAVFDDMLVFLSTIGLTVTSKKLGAKVEDVGMQDA
jgi:hypothetical protein